MWTPEVETKCNEYGKIRRLYQQGRVSAFTLKAVRNAYYYTIPRAKKVYRRCFLQGADKNLGESKRCWIALMYTKSWVSSTTPTLQNPESNQAKELEDNATMILSETFPHGRTR